MHHVRSIALGVLSLLVICTAADAQTKPWDEFPDPLSAARCDLVNVANGQLAVLTVTGEMVFISGPDVILEDTFVDLDGNVFYLGEPAGFIDFATDDDGLRSHWWLAITGQVVSVNGFTGEPTVTSMRPSDFRDVPCDACDFWDDPSVCVASPNPDPPIVTINLCGTNAGMSMALTAVGLGFMGASRRRRFVS